MDLKLWEYIFEMFNYKIRQKKSIFSKLETLTSPLRLNVSPIPVQIVESRGAPSSYAVLKKFHGLAWWKF